ncbi:hypothetical protein U472_11280 [Orenia metallireducens]|jgi:uncharacterized BrkB/YihY/UPF0761 family membrane protein|uniref:Uncharacterized protein n=1 Tax=Orenia metallireducens TaxID=1413210 RepID=A0A1C0A8L9_9FIRM|nr:CBO0543 family protein [Orenia metallireducens]OCL26564.1 hypothetical protein U472_11280 [Orenia metallireducens]
MFFIGRFTLVWIIWLIFADKKRWRELFPTAIFAGLLGSITDNIMDFYKLWDYNDNIIAKELLVIFDDLGIYIVSTYLFIQWLPKEKNFKNLFKYILSWTTITLSIEAIHIYTGHMYHYNFWNLGWSYLADWLLFFLFYFFYKQFQFDKLNTVTNS